MYVKEFLPQFTNTNVKFLKSRTNDPLYGELNTDVLKVPPYQFLSLCKYLPEDKHGIYTYISNLSENLLQECILITDSPGNNVGHAYFLIPVQDADSEDARREKSQSALEEIKKELPEYHTREIRRALFEKFGRISSHVKPYALRYVYRALTSDCSAPAYAAEAEVDRRVLQIVEMEDPDIVPDLRVHNAGRKAIFDAFWSACEQVLQEQLGLAVDDDRHGDVQHMACVVSVRDLWQQAKRLCPEGTPVPSPEWLRLQFWPKSKHAKVSL